MYERPKLSHHKHSGRVRPHEYTSYIPLFCLLLVVGLALIAFSVSSLSSAAPGPEAGSIGLSGDMPGPPPKVAATITSPKNGQRFSATPVEITGSCPNGTLVQIYKNDIFAGSSPCNTDGTYTIEVDLLIGQNVLIARVYDALNQPGPDSSPVTVFYDVLPFQGSGITPLSFGGSQMLLNTDAVFRGAFPERQLNVPIDIIGGTPPYAVEIQWGDSSNKVVPRNDNLTFTVGHTYKKPGNYPITLQATDSQDRVAFLTVAAIVNGQPNVLPVAATDKTTMNKLLVLWPLYVGCAAMVLSFWLGERREKRILGNANLTPHPQG
jgi:hypothetical protein